MNVSKWHAPACTNQSLSLQPRMSLCVAMAALPSPFIVHYLRRSSLVISSLHCTLRNAVNRATMVVQCRTWFLKRTVLHAKTCHLNIVFMWLVATCNVHSGQEIVQLPLHRSMTIFLVVDICCMSLSLWGRMHMYSCFVMYAYFLYQTHFNFHMIYIPFVFWIGSQAAIGDLKFVRKICGIHRCPIFWKFTI